MDELWRNTINDWAAQARCYAHISLWRSWFALADIMHTPRLCRFGLVNVRKDRVINTDLD